MSYNFWDFKRDPKLENCPLRVVKGVRGVGRESLRFRVSGRSSDLEFGV